MTQFCNERQTEHALVAEDLVQFLVPHLGEGRVHHHDQSHRNRDRSCADAEAIQERHDSGHQPSQYDPNGHGGEDPAGEITIQKAETAGGFI